MITALTITHAGRSQTHELELDEFVSDADVIRVAEEVSGLVGGTLANFVVDRLRGLGGEDAVYVRPKVPFGSNPHKRWNHPDRGLLARMSANIASGFVGNPEIDVDIPNDRLAKGCVKLARAIMVEIDSSEG